jgi:ankyrin repeat protein
MGVSFKGYPEIARELIRHGADLNLQNGNGGTALMFATLFGRNNLVKLLVEAGADQTIADVRGLTARGLALQQGNEEALQVLA